MSENALAPEKIAEARKEFDFFDADGSGTIGLREFIDLLTVLSPICLIVGTENQMDL